MAEMEKLQAELNQAKAIVKELQEWEILILDTMVDPSTVDPQAGVSIVSLLADTTPPKDTGKQSLEESDKTDKDAPREDVDHMFSIPVEFNHILLFVQGRSIYILDDILGMGHSL
ncbi:hypothetical protein HAX54_039288 [Datura stramonium]|uniref:Uncharacterized protein n=1 Tax=Datura stramonium TaxID=4076 RepID=A0ABS8VQA8_DATST|nr:hypothetical protein [Datura stramonium]